MVSSSAGRPVLWLRNALWENFDDFRPPEKAMSVTGGHSSETLSPEIISESLSKHATKNNRGWWVVAYT